MRKRITFLVALGLLFFCCQVKSASPDMVDVSNNNGYMTVANFVDMRNNYGVKSILLKSVKELTITTIRRLITFKRHKPPGFILTAITLPLIKLCNRLKMKLIMLASYPYDPHRQDLVQC